MFKVSASEVRRLGTRLRNSQPDVHRAVRLAVLDEARKVAESARGKADWSTRIPATIKVSAAGVNTAVVRAGGAKAPHAKAYEHAGRSGQFRHPVHADPSKTRDQWTWVSEDARPFLHPAALQRLPETVRVLSDAVAVAAQAVIDKAV